MDDLNFNDQDTMGALDYDAAADYFDGLDVAEWDDQAARPEQDVEPIEVLTRLRPILAAYTGMNPTKLASMLERIQKATLLRSRLDATQSKVLDGLVELLSLECANRVGGRVDFHDVPFAEAQLYGSEVVAELARVADCPPAPDPTVAFAALVEQVQRAEYVAQLRSIEQMVANRAPLSDLLRAHRSLIHPTTQTSDGERERRGFKARHVWQDIEARSGGAEPMRIASGLLSLDMAVSRDTDNIGLVALGELVFIAGYTGTGKTTFCYTTLGGMVQDLINRGYSDALVAYAHTEEEEQAKLEGAGFAPGGEFAHLGDNLAIRKVGTSRRALVGFVYDMVEEAALSAHRTGRPITDFVPYAMMVDYVQQISEAGESSLQANETNGNLLLNGLANFSPQDMAKFGGLSYEEHTGTAWPEGLEHHRMAVVAFGQFKTLNQNTLKYRSGMSLSDFALPVVGEGQCPNPWTGPDGVNYWWEVKDNNLRLLGQNEIDYGVYYLKHATTVMFLHRSLHEGNPAHTDANGQTHLADVRARIVLTKTRNGSAAGAVEMEFDVNPRTSKARFFDRQGEHFATTPASQGLLADQYAGPGTVLLPRRQAQPVFAGVSYF